MDTEVERDFRFVGMEVRRHWYITRPAGEVMINVVLRSSFEMA